MSIATADADVTYCQFSVCVNAKTVLLSYAPAEGLEPAEYIPISDISYLSSVGSSAVRTILSTPSSFTKPLEDIGTRNISKSKFVFVE